MQNGTNERQAAAREGLRAALVTLAKAARTQERFHDTASASASASPSMTTISDALPPRICKFVQRNQTVFRHYCIAHYVRIASIFPLYLSLLKYVFLKLH